MTRGARLPAPTKGVEGDNGGPAELVDAGCGSISNAHFGSETLGGFSDGVGGLRALPSFGLRVACRLAKRRPNRGWGRASVMPSPHLPRGLAE